MDEFFVNQTENEYFRVEMFAPLSEIMPNLDANGIYTIEVHIDNTQYRSCAAYFDGAIVKPLSLNGTTSGQIRSASDKYFEFVDYTGAAIQTLTVNGKLKLDIRFNKAVKTPYSSDLQIVKIKVIRKYPNTQVALAKRDEAAYTYGFNGMERDDEVKGSGNSYDFGARMLDPRLGRWFAVDPQAARGAQYSPYGYSFNNPIAFSDPDGEWAVWVHYKMTRKALMKAGFKKETAKDIAYYASTYADNPNFLIRSASKIVGMFNGYSPSQFSKNEKKYQNSEMDGSQSDNGPGVTIHSMMAYFETITEDVAVDRALNGGVFTDENEKETPIEGANKVIKRLSGIKEDDLTQDQKQEIGVALHTIQDAEAHEGGKWAEGRKHKKIAKEMGSPKRHSLWRDVFGNKDKSKGATDKAAKTLKGS
ncbi:MAG: RHS repeat-associated core domain-containing protein [Bacteroidetes bacterium]|nr:RHS repeat-associated core domain-containing protein [Bacteroidota bacterium]NOG56880.1 RHS repeat-associated core domain-containing protein [Bacteroidota bacterium]